MFKQLREKVTNNFNKMATGTLFNVAVNKEEIWDVYLSGFDEEVRQEYNCNNCKSFLRQWGGIVALVDNKIVSLWDDIDMPEYNNAISKLKRYVHSLPIENIFYESFKKCGTDNNISTTSGIKWYHFFLELPNKFVNQNVDSVRGQFRDAKNVFKRSLDELTVDATETVLELIAQNSLYKGKESEALLTDFLKLQKQYAKIPDGLKDNFVWSNTANVPVPLAKIRNTALGTLLINLSEGMSLDAAVTKFEVVVAPSNYKRPTALVTPKMVEQAKAKLEEMGLMNALERRYATEADLNINDIIFTDVTEKANDVFAEISKSVAVNPRSLAKVEEISIGDFLNKVVPTAKAIDVLVENSHISNLVSILTSIDPDAPHLFKWDNNFSWSYSGGITDSLKEKVAKLGGRVDGVFRFSHSWNEIEPNQSLMDLHVFMPGNSHEYGKSVHDNYGAGRRVGWNQRSDPASGGNQDVDYVNMAPTGYVPVENITFPSLSKMPEGKYICKVHNWSFRTSGGRGKAELEVGGNIYEYEYPRTKNKEWVTVAEVTLKDGMFSVNHVLPESSASKEKWNLTTNQFHKVSKLMLSPNHWNGTVGNKHYFFLLTDAKSDESPRPFFNEFLKQEFDENRKVFEILGSKIKVADSDNQLSGLGFSETQRNHVIVKVKGAFERMLKVKF